MDQNANTQKPSVTLWVGISTAEWSNQEHSVKTRLNQAFEKGEVELEQISSCETGGLGFKVLQFDSTILIPPSQYTTLCGPHVARIRDFIKRWGLREDTAIGCFLTPELITY